MNKQYIFFGLFFCTFLIYSENEMSYKDKIILLKTEIADLQKQRDNTLITIQEEIQKTKSSSSPLWLLLNPVILLWLSHFIKEPSIVTFMPLIPYLYCIKSMWPSYPYDQTSSLITLESMIKQKKEKIKELKSTIAYP